MRALLRAASVVFLLVVVLPAFADGPPFGGPRRPVDPLPWNEKPAPKTATLSLTVYAGPATKATTVSFPAAALTRLRAELPPGKGDDTGGTALPAWHTMIAGVALSAALVLGGLWLARRLRKRALAGVACLLGATVVVGLSCGPSNNVVVPDYGTLPEIDPPTMRTDGTLAGRGRLERGTGDDVVLAINREALTKLAQQAPKEDAR